MVRRTLNCCVARVTYPKRADISVVPATQIILRDAMRGVKMKQIKLTQGKFALVDDSNFEWLSQLKWYARKGVSTWYVACSDGSRKIMHRIIMNTPKGMDTDHINGNGLDNRKCNLRVCSRSQHHYNRTPKKGKYKGVNMGGRGRKWQARITVEGKRISLGYYKRQEDAARAYDIVARKYFGEFARTNFL